MVEHSHEIGSDEERMKALLENVSAYIEQYHGGWVELVSFEEGFLEVRMGGACEGCPLTETTLRGWVEGTVRQFFPDIKGVKAVE
jgi:Fe-S cluster biogenesis protein NfuA